MVSPEPGPPRPRPQPWGQIKICTLDRPLASLRLTRGDGRQDDFMHAVSDFITTQTHLFSACVRV